MKHFPIIFLFFSGSEIPLNLNKNILDASMIFSLIFNDLVIFLTSSTSFFLRRPVSIKIQVNCFPIALLRIAATTEESTPPDNARITLFFATFCLVFSIRLFVILFAVHDFLQLHILLKLSSIFSLFLYESLRMELSPKYSFY